MKDVHNWFKTVDQLVVSITKVLELLYFDLNEFEDSVSGLAVLELFGEWIFG